jgi:hypothetical protein
MICRYIQGLQFIMRLTSLKSDVTGCLLFPRKLTIILSLAKTRGVVSVLLVVTERVIKN